MQIEGTVEGVRDDDKTTGIPPVAPPRAGRPAVARLWPLARPNARRRVIYNPWRWLWASVVLIVVYVIEVAVVESGEVALLFSGVPPHSRSSSPTSSSTVRVPVPVPAAADRQQVLPVLMVGVTGGPD